MLASLSGSPQECVGHGPAACQLPAGDYRDDPLDLNSHFAPYAIAPLLAPHEEVEAAEIAQALSGSFIHEAMELVDVASWLRSPADWKLFDMALLANVARWLCQQDPLPLRAARVTLTGREERNLKRVIRAGKSEQRLVLRAQIVLLAKAGLSNGQIAQGLGCDIQTARKWRNRFVKYRLDGLADAPRSGRPDKFESSQKHEVIKLILSEPPAPYAKWTLDLATQELVRRGIVTSISRESISSWLRTAEIKPHRVKYWLNSKDPQFREKMLRVVDLYVNPPKDGRVVCVDEKTGVQALERRYPDLPCRPGRIRGVEFEYIRHGTVGLLAAFEVRTGHVLGECLEGRNNSQAFIKFLKRLLLHYPSGKIYLVMDNGTTHVSKMTKAFLAQNPRFVPVYLPTHASWLNQIEIWFSALSRQALRHVSFKSRSALKNRILHYIEVHNSKAHPYKWTSKGQPLKA